MLENYKLDTDKNSFIALLKKGNKIALETLFKLYYDKLLHLSKNYLTREEDGEEIVQNVFLKMWEQREKLKDVSNINSYLHTMTKNACLDYLKHEKVKLGYIEQNLLNKTTINYQFLKDEAASLLLEKELEQ
ncbi:MAG: sigma-70 family RNA polymerase sigma factor, partial [Ekhidna sp.]